MSKTCSAGDAHKSGEALVVPFDFFVPTDLSNYQNQTTTERCTMKMVDNSAAKFS